MKSSIRYACTYENILSLEVLKNKYQMVTTNLELARKKKDTKFPASGWKLKGGDSVILRDFMGDEWDPKYT